MQKCSSTIYKCCVHWSLNLNLGNEKITIKKKNKNNEKNEIENNEKGSNVMDK